MLPILSSASIAGQFFDGACEAKSFALFVRILEPFLVAKLYCCKCQRPAVMLSCMTLYAPRAKSIT